MFKEVHAQSPCGQREAAGGKVFGAGREAGPGRAVRGSGELMEVLTGSFWKVAAGRRDEEGPGAGRGRERRPESGSSQEAEPVGFLLEWM